MTSGLFLLGRDRDMELLEYKNELFNLLDIESIERLPEALENAVGDCDLRNRYIETFGWRDWIRELYQYYLADRENMKQDYTPESLSKLCGEIVGQCETIVDLCAGSGSLSIHSKSEGLECVELDEGVLPFLKFNLFLNGRKAQILHGDALTASVRKAEGCISNPPFNLPYEGADLPCKTGNWAFVYKALNSTVNRAAIILPQGVLSERRDLQAVQDLVQEGHLEAVISCPERMFDSTSIPVCVIVVNWNRSDKTVFIDASGMAEKQIRTQRGQYGGRSHTNRVYKKEVNVFSDEAIAKICDLINNKKNSENSAAVESDEILKNQCNLSPLRYIKQTESEDSGNSIKWIAEQYNRLVRMKNACKLTINESLAKELGIDQQLWEESKRKSQEVAETIYKISGLKIEKEDYLTFTKSRELTLRFKSKEELPAIFNQFIQLWINQTVMLNQLENSMLSEMRDCLLPKLMDGTLEV